MKLSKELISLLEIARANHIRVVLTSRVAGALREPVWTGFEIICEPEVDELAHEIAHYCVATEAMRRLPNFGLGTVAGFDSGTGIQPQQSSDTKRYDVEAQASLLGILMMRELKTRSTKWTDTLNDHNWSVDSLSGRREFMLMIRKLRRMGLLKKWRPTCLDAGKGLSTKSQWLWDS